MWPGRSMDKALKPQAWRLRITAPRTVTGGPNRMPGARMAGVGGLTSELDQIT